LTTEGVVVWEFAPTFDAAHRAALESGKPLIYVCPPAGWALAPLLRRLPPVSGPTPPALVLVPDPADVADVTAAAHGLVDRAPTHGVTGLSRAHRLLAAGAVRTLVCTPADAVALARQSALALAAVRQLVVAWPEHMLALDQGPTLDTVLAETHAAHRFIATTDDRRPDLTDLVTRLAHRAPILTAARPPEQPLTATVRWFTAGGEDRLRAAVAVLDILHPHAAIVWDPAPRERAAYDPLTVDPGVSLWEETTVSEGTETTGGERAALAIALDVPSADVLGALLEAAREVVVVVRPSQVAYLGQLAADLRSLRVAGEADRAVDRALAVRRQVRARLAEGQLDAELLALGPLLDEFDPALVAAAALALREGIAVPAEPEATGWTRIRLSAGRRDGIRPGDIVGALVNEVGLTRTAVGRIELKDSFALVEIAAAEAERAARGLTGTSLRGRRVTARVERR
jgi:ATP-dependent RNA helicase DeaD